MTHYPDDVRYSEQHLWVRTGDGHDARVGATGHLVESIGTVVHVSQPIVGSRVVAGDACGELVTPSAARALISPLSGVVTAVNATVVDQPELLALDGYGAAWLFDIEVDGDELVTAPPLLDAAEYQSLVED